AATERYRLGIGIVELAGVVLDELDLRRGAAPFLRQLAGAAREAIKLAIWGGPRGVVIEHLPSPRPVKYICGGRPPQPADAPPPPHPPARRCSPSPSRRPCAPSSRPV